MPELPEVETIRQSLIPFIIGKTISEVEILSPKQFRGNKNDLVGREIKSIFRHGKVMSWQLQTKHGKEIYISIHLKMSGSFSLRSSKHSRIVFRFSDKTSLYFNDARKFGWIKILPEPEVGGVDVLSTKLNVKYLHAMLSQTNRSIKAVLLDQSIIAGIGNIYANDCLWEAKINPLTKANCLSTDQIETLLHMIKMIIKEGIKHKGSSKTWVYKLPDGSIGNYQNRFRVYDQEDKPCKRCGTKILRIVRNGRSSWYCPRCQPL